MRLCLTGHQPSICLDINPGCILIYFQRNIYRNTGTVSIVDIPIWHLDVFWSCLNYQISLFAKMPPSLSCVFLVEVLKRGFLERTSQDQTNYLYFWLSTLLSFFDFYVSVIWVVNFFPNKFWSCFWSNTAFSRNKDFTFFEYFMK